MTLAAKIQKKLRLKWHYAYNDMRSFVGINDRMFKETLGARILVYHGICRVNHTRFNSIFLRLKTFEAHLQFYRKYFNVISLDDFYNERFSKERFNICITFDDGFSNNYKYVLPLINKYKLPVTFFITGIRDTGGDILWNDFLAIAQKYGPSEFQFLDDLFYKNKYSQYVSRTNHKTLKDLLREHGFDKKEELIKNLQPLVPFKSDARETDYWLQMTEEEIRILSASPLVTIGCHGYYHNDLSRIPIDDARNEMKRCKHFLENTTEKEINAIAFPYGAYTREVVKEAKLAGFNKLLAADFIFPEDSADQSMRERFTMNPYISINNQMTAIVNGKYQK
jgi:peptidoglycan/xylan/chitin deacetylase (PgdA/CDA1 family)